MGSVGDNIRYNSECDETAIETAADIAHARRFIEEWE
jgi:ABC-type multidrug transport system fused ATPase/permease subunit